MRVWVYTSQLMILKFIGEHHCIQPTFTDTILVHIEDHRQENKAKATMGSWNYIALIACWLICSIIPGSIRTIVLAAYSISCSIYHKRYWQTRFRTTIHKSYRNRYIQFTDGKQYLSCAHCLSRVFVCACVITRMLVCSSIICQLQAGNMLYHLFSSFTSITHPL